MRTALPFLLILGSALVLAACDTTSETDDVIDLITRSPWAPTDVTLVPGLAERYEFQASGTLILTFAGGATQRTEWALDEEGTVLVVRAQDGGQLNIPIVLLTEDDLVLEFDGVEVAFVHV